MPIIANKKENQRKKPAKSQDLAKITFAVLQSAHVLTLLERRWFSFFVALAKLGYSGISASISEITDHEYRVNHQTHSERSTYRALSGLQSKNFISRKRFRVGPDKFRVEIFFHFDSFRWYLQKSSSNVAHNTTCTYTHTQLPTWQEDLPTSNTSVLTSNSVSNLLKSKKRASSKKHEKTPKIATYLLPILVTLRAMLPGARRVLGAPRSLILDRAEREMSSGDDLSGIDWLYWSGPRWTDMSHDERDHIALTEIVPQLISPRYGLHNTDESLDRLVSALANPETESSPPPEVLTREQVANSRPPPEVSLDDEEFRALLEARERSRARRVAGW